MLHIIFLLPLLLLLTLLFHVIADSLAFLGSQMLSKSLLLLASLLLLLFLPLLTSLMSYRVSATTANLPSAFDVSNVSDVPVVGVPAIADVPVLLASLLWSILLLLMVFLPVLTSLLFAFSQMFQLSLVLP
jgi:hypothetical protein